MKVLFHYDAGPKLKTLLESYSDFDIVCCPETDQELFLKEVVDCDVIWHVLEPLTADILRQAPGLKLIQKIGVGTNTIDLDYCREHGISVCNMPGTNSRAVAEMTLMMILAALRRMPLLDKACRSGKWWIDKEVEEDLGELYGKTVGLVGYGAVPKVLAPMLDALGAKIVYTATAPKAEVSYPFLSMNELLQCSDIVSLHLGLNEATEKIINEMSIANMKTGAILINTGRGGLVDELALYAALLNEKLAAAALDVFQEEPVPADNKLLSLDQVVVAPHVAWISQQTWQRSLEVASANSIAIAKGEKLHFPVVSHKNSNAFV